MCRSINERSDSAAPVLLRRSQMQAPERRSCLELVRPLPVKLRVASACPRPVNTVPRRGTKDRIAGMKELEVAVELFVESHRLVLRPLIRRRDHTL